MVVSKQVNGNDDGNGNGNDYGNGNGNDYKDDYGKNEEGEI